jgi:hypothetical protein
MPILMLFKSAMTPLLAGHFVIGRLLATFAGTKIG